MFQCWRCRDEGLKYWKVCGRLSKNTIETSKFSTVVILVILTGMTCTARVVHQPFYFEWNSCISWWCEIGSPGLQSGARWQRRWWRRPQQSPGGHSLCLHRRQWRLPWCCAACHWRWGLCKERWEGSPCVCWVSPGGCDYDDVLAEVSQGLRPGL